MAEQVSLGNNNKTGKTDFKLKDEIKKADVVGNNKKLESIFDKVDINKDQILDQSELQAFQDEINNYYELLNLLATDEQDAQNTQQETVVEQTAGEIVPESTTDESSDVADEASANVAEEEDPVVTSGIIVQNGESPAMIAKKFGVSVEDLLAANEEQLKGKGQNKYFLVGAEIVIPRKIEEEELAQLTKNRKSASETTGDYAHAMAVKEQHRAQQQAENEALGIENRNGAGQKITGKYKGGETEEFTVIGEAGRGRRVARSKSGKIVTIAADGVILKDSYVQNTNFYDRKDTKKVTINGKQYAVAGSRGDKRGRSVAVDEKGNQVVISADNKVLRNDYVSATDARDAGASRGTLTGGENITYVKDANGKVWYFDEKTGKALIKGQYSAMVKKEADQVAQDLLDGANYTWGTDEEKIKKGIRNIYSPEIMASVNNTLKSKDNTYTGDTMTTPVEALLLDELSRSEVRDHIKTLAANGAYGTGKAKDAALGRNAAREIKYEVHGGITGYTGTKDLKEAMDLASTRGARLHAEQLIGSEVKGSANEGSMVRAYIAEDGWNAQEVDQFDATWIKNGAYDHKHDQEHRNAVTGRLVFEYGNDESLYAGLEAIDPESADYQYVSTRAAEENEKQGYQAHFNNQEALQTYIAGRATLEDETVKTPKVSACNTLLYKGEKPVRIQAEEALYDAQSGNFSTMFDSMDPKVYEEMADMIADGEIPNCKGIQEAYAKALNSATSSNDKTTIKANAIISGQIEFSDAEIADFCVELMHNIDSNKGAGASTGVSAKHTNTAEYMTEQLKAILQANPQVIASVKEQVENGTFESTSSTIRGGGSFGGGSATITTQNNKDKYLAIINDSKYVADEAVFYDKDGKKITNPEEITALTNANMQALQGMRDYVAQLERDFKKGVDAEGGLSNMANGLLIYSGVGTDRDDVANQYRNAKLMLGQLEAAAQGKLRDSEGNVISAQDLAQKFVETQDGLAETNSSYQSSVQTAKMGIVLAPVIVATTIASGGTNLLLGSTMAATTAGTLISGTAAGVAAGATTYGLNAYEYNSSLTGNTAEAREQNAIDSTVAGVSTGIGFVQMKPIMGMANGLNTTARTSVRFATTVTSDITVGAAGEYLSTGNISAQGTLMNAGFSAVGNVAGLKSLGKKTEIPATHGQPEVNPNGRDQIADGVAARNIDQQHVNANQQRLVEEGLADVPTPEELATYQKEHGYQPVSEVDRPAFEAHQKHVAADYTNAHELDNMVDASSADALQRAKANMEADTPAPAAPKPDAPIASNQTEVEKLTQSLADIDEQIKRAESNLASKARRGKQPTLQEKQQLERMRANRDARQAELDALQKSASEPEVGVKPEEPAAEPIVKAEEVENTIKPDEADTVARVEDAELVVTPEEVPTPENITRDVQAIPEALIPVEHRNLWESCKEKVGKMFSGAGKLAAGEVKKVFADLKTLYNAVKNPKLKTQIKNLYSKIQAYVKSKQASKPIASNQNLPPVVKTPHGDFIPVTTRKEAEDVFNRLVTDRTSDFSDIDNLKPKKGAAFHDLGREYWLESAHHIKQGTKWKIHLYANSAEEWANVAQVALPYLEKNPSLGFKTVRNFDKLEGLRHSQKYGDGQTGKAFTVYFENEDAFLKAADELGTLFDNSGLRSSGRVKNEAQIGESGFVSYRNEAENRLSSNYKPEGMEDPYLKAQAEKNAAPVQAQAPAAPRGMSLTEEKIMVNEIIGDINNAKTPAALSKIQKKINDLPESSSYKAELQRQFDEKSRVMRAADSAPAHEPVIVAEPIADFSNAKVGSRLPKNEPVTINGTETLELSGYQLDLSHPEYQAKLQAMKDGDVIIVGRHTDEKGISIDEAFDTVSGKHLTIEKVGDQFVVTDMSTNGTKVGKSMAHIDGELKTTFGHRTVQEMSALKPGQKTTVTKGDIAYTIQNVNGRIKIVNKTQVATPQARSIDFEGIKMSNRTPAGQNNPGKSMGELLTTEQKKVYTSSLEAFERSKGRNIRHNANNMLNSDNLLHGTDLDALISKGGILDEGLVPREISGNSTAAYGDGSIPDTLTPLCSDVWDVSGQQSIREYFDANNSHWQNAGESNFLPNTYQKRSGLVIVFDKNSMDPTLVNNSFGVNNQGRSVLFENGNMSRGHNYPTHRAIPIGTPANTIEKIIVDTRTQGRREIKALKQKIEANGLDIKLYDMNGNLL